MVKSKLLWVKTIKPMKKAIFVVLILIVNQISFASTLGETKIQPLRNNQYEIRVNASYEIIINRRGQDESKTIKPNLLLQFAQKQPELTVNRLYNNVMAGWHQADRNQKTFRQDGTGRSDDQVETDLFKVGQLKSYYATGVESSGENDLLFTFEPSDLGSLTLTVRLPTGEAAPQLEMGFVPNKDGWFSIGFYGLTPRDTSEIAFNYLPMNWTWRRFPDKAYLVPESFCLQAATFINDGTYTEGIAAHPSEIPYRFATSYGGRENSRFGLALRDQEGKARPMLFAPVFGGEESHMKAGESYTFVTQYVLDKGDWYTGVQHMLYNLFNYRIERQNATVSLNETLENMIDFAMGPYSGWMEEYKANDYRQDGIGTVKNVSALHPLGVALVTGNMEIYRKRALPMMEYMLSREKYLFAVDTTQKNQHPSHLLKGPTAEIGELSGLYDMTGKATKVFKQEAERIFGKPRKLNLTTVTGGGSWQDYLARYRMTGNHEYLDEAVEQAKQEADRVINRYPTDIPRMFFYTETSPKVFDYLELYEETKEPVFLKASSVSARNLLLQLRSNPMAPDSVITINKGGIVMGWTPKQYKPNSYESFPGFDYTNHIPEQEVPAWRTSLVGLSPESGGTYLKNGPIMLAHHAPFFLRLATLTGDSLLSDAAYNAVIGRYANFPGYYHTSLHTNIYQTPDYPLHDFMDMRYNNMFYNHVWPHIAMLVDFLISDAYRLSADKVNFPSAYAPGYAFLVSKVYGHEPGEIFGHKNVKPWLPAQSAKVSDVALNHLYGAGEEDFFMVLMNTADRVSDSEITLNPDVIPWNYDHPYPLEWIEADGSSSEGKMLNGTFKVNVPPRGMQVVRIKGLKVDIPLQRQASASAAKVPAENTYLRVATKSALGTITGMIFNMVPQFADAYVYTDATEKTFQKAKLTYRLDGGTWQTIIDEQYPYEFSIHLDDPASVLEFQLIGKDLAGNEVAGELMKINY